METIWFVIYHLNSSYYVLLLHGKKFKNSGASLSCIEVQYLEEAITTFDLSRFFV